MSLSLPAAIRLLLPDGAVKTILLEDYLRGVAAAALDADAPLEAMKALAVAARTFAARTHRHLERGADLCATRHCQQWNERANPRAARAVMETRGIVATHDDQFIEAFYFEHCDGKTRGAQGVLVNAPAYLKSVTCPCGFAALKGHGIGMCLRGMVALARLGEQYDFILQHYYSGVTLEQLDIDEKTRRALPLTPKHAPTRAPQTAPKPAARARPTPRRAKPAEPPPITPAVSAPLKKSEPPPSTPQTAPKPAPKPTPRHSTRSKLEHAPLNEPPRETPEQAAPPSFIAPRIEPKPESEDADDFISFLAVEEVAHTAERAQTPEGKTQAMDIPLAAPPLSMPEEFISPAAAPPPASMPEDLPNALELEFIAPPRGAPEEIISDFVAPPTAHIIEPDLGAFLPPIEKFYTPLDAPPSMPEDMPSFTAERTDETPIAWAPPPPLYESAAETRQPQILMDALPGPRVIAGNLPRLGMLVSVSDAAGNRTLTVSGVARHYGAGGFEAPLTADGAYHVKFDDVEMDVQVSSETVFIYYQ